MNVFEKLGSVGLVIGAVALSGGAAVADAKLSMRHPVNISVSYTISLKGDSSNADEPDALYRKARRIVYQRAKAECEDLLEFLAKTCEMKSLNVRGAPSRRNQYDSSSITVTGAAQYIISPK